MKPKTVEEIYQKKTPLEHILLRPDTYIGTVEPCKEQKWVLDKGQPRFTCRQIAYTPGFYKIFDEVLVNAADNYQRDKKMNQIKVTINQDEGYITVLNNGKGIPIVIHKEHKIYVPELIFGHLLTGSNYNDDEKRIVGGRNGYGAKLANVFSNKFIVECGDSQNQKKFKMVWKNSMNLHGQPEIAPYSGKDYVSVTFYPCFRLFNMQRLDEDIFALISKRVYDMAGILPRVKVSLNENLIDIKSFSEYVDMYFEKQSSPTKIFDKEVNTERWDVIVSVSDGEFKQVSFVNGVCTSKGGTHVNYLIDQIVDKIQQKIKKKEKDLNIKPFQIKAHLWIFANCLIENPTFDTQTKETLTLKASQFGSKYDLSDKMIKDILKLGIVDTIIELAKTKQMSKLAKVTGGGKKSKITGIPKLDDANEAGGKLSEKCTLILTEGDSAKTLAMSGLSVIGRDFYGVFPLRGKLLNVRDVSTKQLLGNEEIQNLLKIIGLQIGKQYNDMKQLRYGAIMIMSDQDTDGSHIKGLVINFIHHFWPSLFKINGFLKQFITPLLKVTKSSNVISFYTMNDFKRWAESIPNIKYWTIKYYKGLGTSNDKEAKEYFSDLRKHKIDFRYIDIQDDNAIELIFSKKRIQDRKRWLDLYDPKTTIQYNRPQIRFKEFVDCQFIHFSNEDNHRSIASLIDGFKPGQRKILFGCFKRNLIRQIKVAQLGGYIAQNSAYHHGQMSLVETIVGMAQNFVGSNNVNLLMPNGQFGSRALGGKDHASARYIFTTLNRVARLLFPEADDHTLAYVEDDGQIVEPEYYVPIIPMILVNGCQGIGTGWSTYIPNFNPRQICELIKKKLNGQDFVVIHPWFKNFRGPITPNSENSAYQVQGHLRIDQNKQSTIIIDQLPISKWTKDYKGFIDDIMAKGQQQIIGLREYHTKDSIHFQIQMNQQFFSKLYEGQETYKLEKYFKLSSSISMRNLVGFNQQSKLMRMNGVCSILNMFYNIRLQFYQKRKQYLKSRLRRQLVELEQKERFILQVVQEKIVIRNVKKLKICQILKERKYVKYSELPKIISTKIQEKKSKKEGEEEESEKENQINSEEEKLEKTPQKILAKQYDYLLSMSLWNLSYEKVEQIKEKKCKKSSELETLQKKTVKEVWIQDIDTFLKVLGEVEADEKKERVKQDQQMKKNFGQGKVQKAKKKNNPPKKEKKKNQYDWLENETETDQSFLTKKESKKQKEKKNSLIQKQANDQQNRKIKKESKKPSQSEPDDFMERIKKKLSEAPDQYLTTKPVQKQTTIEEILSNSKKQKQRKQEYEIVPNPNKTKKKSVKLNSEKKSHQKKSKMLMDSDEQEVKWSQYSSDESENEDQEFLKY